MGLLIIESLSKEIGKMSYKPMGLGHSLPSSYVRNDRLQLWVDQLEAIYLFQVVVLISSFNYYCCSM